MRFEKKLEHHVVGPLPDATTAIFRLRKALWRNQPQHPVPIFSQGAFLTLLSSQWVCFFLWRRHARNPFAIGVQLPAGFDTLESISISGLGAVFVFWRSRELCGLIPRGKSAMLAPVEALRAGVI